MLEQGLIKGLLIHQPIVDKHQYEEIQVMFLPQARELVFLMLKLIQEKLVYKEILQWDTNVLHYI
jgi:hypothetical protein